MFFVDISLWAFQRLNLPACTYAHIHFISRKKVRTDFSILTRLYKYFLSNQSPPKSTLPAFSTPINRIRASRAFYRRNYRQKRRAKCLLPSSDTRRPLAPVLFKCRNYRFIRLSFYACHKADVFCSARFGNNAHGRIRMSGRLDLCPVKPDQRRPCRHLLSL